MSGELFWRNGTPKKPGSVRRTNELMRKTRTRSDDEDKFAEFNNQTDDAWLDDSQTDLEFYLDPRETAGTGLSKLNIALEKRPSLLPRATKENTANNIYGSVGRPVQTQSAGTSSSSTQTSDVDHSKRHTVNREEKQKARFHELFKSDCPDIDAIKKAAWFGCPRQYRPLVWQILSGYLPPNKTRRADTLGRKRSEYWRFVAQYFKTRTDANFSSLYHQIHIDIPRTNPAVPLFQEQKVQDAFERVLYIWAYRNPGSGYVQGINDLVTPFYVVFLSQYIEGNVERADISQLADEILANTEADTYWCLCKLLESLHDNYTFAQPGIQMKVHDLRRLVNRIDKQLDEHLERNVVEYLQFSFRWMNNLLMREMPLSCTIRLWDTYFAEPNGFSHFHLYVCAKFLTRWSKLIKSLPDFQAVMLFLQSLPTSKWTDDEMSELASEAFQLKCLFPKAVTTVAGTT